MTFIIALVAYRDQTEKALIYSIITCFVYTAVMFIYERKIINKKYHEISDMCGMHGRNGNQCI